MRLWCVWWSFLYKYLIIVDYAQLWLNVPEARPYARMLIFYSVFYGFWRFLVALALVCAVTAQK